MSKTKPRMIRWRDKVLSDTSLSDRAKFAAAVLVKFADDLNSPECHPSAEKCAEAIGKSVPTIKRGWADLKEAGYLIIELRDSRRKPHAKVMLFPSRNRAGSANQAKPSGISKPNQTERDQFDTALVHETMYIDQDKELKTQVTPGRPQVENDSALGPSTKTIFVPCASCNFYPACKYIGCQKENERERGDEG
jgi:hypothetical protein